MRLLVFLICLLSNSYVFAQSESKKMDLIHIDSLYENKEIFLLKSMKIVIDDTLSNMEVKERIKNWLGRMVNDGGGTIKNETNSQLVSIFIYEGVRLKLLCEMDKGLVELKLFDLGVVDTDYHFSFFFTKDGGIHTIKRFNDDFISKNHYFRLILESIKKSILE